MLSSCVSSLSKICLRKSIFSQSACAASVLHLNTRQLHVTQQNSAARKGTREKARKNKVKVEVKKVGYIPHNQRGRDKYVNLILIFQKQTIKNLPGRF